MKSLIKSHGKHCRLKSFPTHCPKCNANVLYWECSHGSKIFFNYPIYGKLIKHKCMVSNNNYRTIKYRTIIKKPLYLINNNPSRSCPACGKLFKTEKDLQVHLKQLDKIDFLHIRYRENKISSRDKELNDNIENKQKKQDIPKFGRINIKKRN
ncbi:MAG: hypothetical protein ACTSPD_12225 [Promethearchaeota archaeon]